MITTKRCSQTARDCGKLKRAIVNSLACLAVMASGGCVTNSTYNAAVTEAQTAKGELERAKEEQQMLVRQVSELEKLNEESIHETEATLTEALDVKREADAQRREAEGRQTKLQQKISRLIRQHNVLRDDLAVARENHAALQELVDVYQKKLADLAKEREAAPPPEVVLAPKPLDDAAALPPAQALPEPTPAAERSEPATVTAPPPAKVPVPARKPPTTG